MRILIDTNIFIPMEDSSIELDIKIANLHRLASGLHNLLIHPASANDINRDKNLERRHSMLARLKKYSPLESPPTFIDAEEESTLFGTPKKDNDHVDNLILLSLLRNCVHLLITQDEGIHKKSKKLGIYERVLTVDQALNLLPDHNKSKHLTYPNISDIYCHSLNLKNPFFDSLRNGYGGNDFDQWFTEKCSKTGRKAWVCQDSTSIHALAIYKIEDEPIVTIDSRGLRGKVLKICTFKVVKHGFKIGELLLKQVFEFAEKNKIKHAYATIDPGKHELLEDLFSEFGFYKYGVDQKGRDNVFVKDFPFPMPKSNLPPIDYAIKFFPATKLSSNQAYIIPIKPEYHSILFPELTMQKDLFSSTDNSAGNAIKQAYLCKAPINSIQPGDLLFFYRSKDEQKLTTYGVVDKFIIENQTDTIFQWVSKRTVYSYNEIREMAGQDIKIILFRLIRHLKKPLGHTELLNMGILNGAPQSITSLSHDKAKRLLEATEINDCFIPN